MPRIDPNRVVRRDSQLDQFVCTLCEHILDNPTVTLCCRQKYCWKCIDQRLRRHNICPHCLKRLTGWGLKKAPPNVFKIIDEWLIKCQFSEKGCPSVHTIGEESKHLEVCPFAKCRVCGLKEPEPNHSCVTHVLEVNHKLTEDMAKLWTEIAGLENLNTKMISSEMRTKKELIELQDDLDKRNQELLQSRAARHTVMDENYCLKQKNFWLKNQLQKMSKQLKDKKEVYDENLYLQDVIEIYLPIVMERFISEAKRVSGSVEESVDVHQSWNKPMIAICKYSINSFDEIKQDYSELANEIRGLINQLPNLANLVISWNVQIYANFIQWPVTKHNYIRLSFCRLNIELTCDTDLSQIAFGICENELTI